MIEALTGVVLAGGRSSRFGENKALADWGGEPLIRAVTRTLRSAMPRVLVVAKDPGPLAFLRQDGVEIVLDRYEQPHPIGGLLTGLLHAPTEHAFVTSCDAPLLRAELVAGLWEARAHFDAVIPVWDGARQPLCGVYSKRCAPALAASIDAGRLGIAPLFDTLDTRFYLERELQAVDPEGRSFFDIDTREDYERARRLLPC